MREAGANDFAPRLGRLVLYVRDIETTVAFYERHFGFDVVRRPGDRIVELAAKSGGAHLLVHRAAKGAKRAQSAVKLVFDVENVSAFCSECEKRGLDFGPPHDAGGYVYANAKDPDGNSISVSSRVFAKLS